MLLYLSGDDRQSARLHVSYISRLQVFAECVIFSSVLLVMPFAHSGKNKF